MFELNRKYTVVFIIVLVSTQELIRNFNKYEDVYVLRKIYHFLFNSSLELLKNNNYLLSIVNLIAYAIQKGKNINCYDELKNITTTEPNQKPKIILFWTTYYGRPDFSAGWCRKPFRYCGQQNCLTTNDRSLLDKADAVVFHIRDVSFHDLPPHRLFEQKWIFFTHESPINTLYDLRKFDNFFNLTMTYRKDSDIYYPYGITQRRPRPIKFHQATNRSKAVAWVVSHCASNSLRQKMGQQLSKFVSVDIYGKCGRKCSKLNGTDICLHEQLAKYYKFYLSFENSNCKDYVTEKLYKTLRSGLVPIVMGPSRSDYEAIAPPNSFIHVDDYDNTNQLADYINYLLYNDTAYNEYHEWNRYYTVQDWDINNGLDKDKSRKPWCDLCQLLHVNGSVIKTYKNIHKWWINTDNKREMCNNYENYNIF